MKSLSLCIVIMVMAGVFYSSTVLGEGFFDKLEEMLDRVTDSIADKAGERLSGSSDKAIDSTMDRTDEVVCDAITGDECKKSKSSPPPLPTIPMLNKGIPKIPMDSNRRNKAIFLPNPPQT